MKTVCMVGVVLHYVKGEAYSNDKVFYSVWFVVALFLMIGGYIFSLLLIFYGNKVGMTWAYTFEMVLLFFWFKKNGELAELLRDGLVRRWIRVLVCFL